MEVFVEIYNKKDADKIIYSDERDGYSLVDILKNKKGFCYKPFDIGMPREEILKSLEVCDALCPEELDDYNLWMFDEGLGVCRTVRMYLENKQDKISENEAMEYSKRYYEEYHENSVIKSGKAGDRTDNVVDDAINYAYKSTVEYSGAIDRQTFNLMKYGSFETVNVVLESGDYYVAGYYKVCDVFGNKVKSKQKEISKKNNLSTTVMAFAITPKKNGDIHIPERIIVSDISFKENDVSVSDVHVVRESILNKVSKEKLKELMMLMEKERDEQMALLK